jgi:hypothetical protein
MRRPRSISDDYDLRLTFMNASTAIFAISNRVGRPPAIVLWFMDAEVSMRKAMIVMSAEFKGRS